MNAQGLKHQHKFEVISFDTSCQVTLDCFSNTFKYCQNNEIYIKFAEKRLFTNL